MVLDLLVAAECKLVWLDRARVTFLLLLGLVAEAKKLLLVLELLLGRELYGLRLLYGLHEPIL